MENSKHYFGAGPAALPPEVKQKIQQSIQLYAGTGVSILELSHRSEQFLSIINSAQILLRALYSAPENYKIIFMPGGASMQFDAVALNLAGDAKFSSYLDTGFWSRKSAKLASKYVDVRFIEGLNKGSDKICCIKPEDYDVDEGSAFLHVTPNETINGVEFVDVKKTNVPVVADLTSCMLMQDIDISNYGVVYAGTQKSLGIAGLSVVIIRDDLLDRVSDLTPDLLRYDLHVKENSIINTCPVFACYVAQLMLEWVTDNGGIKAMVEKARLRSELLYRAIDSNPKLINNVCVDNRSVINVAFNSPDKQVIDDLLAKANQQGLIGLQGHRFSGGVRASMYNGTPISAVKKLAELIEVA
ncbi:MAG: 3-phosphoserine/phosphohydroxythreonine transaminase [Gammaproteobacteria bacterium]|nr:3-phosphoserine/phosphohydroxythreonine transaminase [Gammaproteobacteria bacterium]